jgi:OOP family OmpA-OmpF porin
VRLFAVCFTALLGLASAAYADPQEKVLGPTNQVIRSEKFGTCVQTKWTASTDICAPAPVPAPVVQAPPPPAPEPVTKLATEQLTIYFAFNKSVVTPESKAKLDQIADAVNRSPHVTKVNIVGYTDQIGTVSYNDKLSIQRAKSVKAYIDSKMRIPAGVADLRGLGEKDPVTTGCKKVKERKKKIECMAKDRRVEIEFEFQQ